MQSFVMAFTFLTALPGAGDQGNKADAAFAKFQVEIIAALAGLDANPKNKDPAEEKLRAQLQEIVDKYSDQLRPAKGSKRYVSTDKRFVLVMAASPFNPATNGEEAKAIDKQAKIVMAVGGDGSARLGNRPAGFGGTAVAQAPNGVAIALGGRGGLGGGGGAGVAAAGGLGSIGLGGEGGKGFADGGAGGRGGGRGIEKARAIVEIAKKLRKK